MGLSLQQHTQAVQVHSVGHRAPRTPPLNVRAQIRLGELDLTDVVVPRRIQMGMDPQVLPRVADAIVLHVPGKDQHISHVQLQKLPTPVCKEAQPRPRHNGEQE